MISCKRVLLLFLMLSISLVACSQSSKKDIPLPVDKEVLNLLTTALPKAKITDSLLTCGVALPVGLSLNANTGEITGVPKEVSTGNVLFTVTGSSTTGSVIGSYDVLMEAEGGIPPYQWTVNSALPIGVALNSTTGSFSGVPTSPGLFPIEVVVADSEGETDFANLVINVLGITTESLPGGIVGKEYVAQLTAKGGELPYTWSVIPCP